MSFEPELSEQEAVLQWPEVRNLRYLPTYGAVKDSYFDKRAMHN